MTRRTARTADKARSVRRQYAIARPEFRQPSEPRTFPAAPLSAAVKIRDPEIARLVDEVIARMARS